MQVLPPGGDTEGRRSALVWDLAASSVQMQMYSENNGTFDAGKIKKSQYVDVSVAGGNGATF